MARPLPLSLAVHLIISLSSLSCACVAGFYVHPFLLPMLTSSVPRLGSAVGAHLTPPILFILLNLLVAALFVTSNMKRPGNRELASKDGVSANAGAGAPNNDVDNQESNDGVFAVSAQTVAPNNDVYDDCSSAFPVDDIHGNDAASQYDVSYEDAQHHTVPCNNALPDVTKPPPQDIEKRHSQPQPQPSRKGGKNRTHLVRSRSDGIMVLGLRKTPSELRPVPRLKKAGTFESTWRRRRVKPVVVVADPPEDGHVAEEEVDKKAEDFIGRFYQRMRSQH